MQVVKQFQNSLSSTQSKANFSKYLNMFIKFLNDNNNIDYGEYLSQICIQQFDIKEDLNYQVSMILFLRSIYKKLNEEKANCLNYTKFEKNLLLMSDNILSIYNHFKMQQFDAQSEIHKLSLYQIGIYGIILFFEEICEFYQNSSNIGKFQRCYEQVSTSELSQKIVQIYISFVDFDVINDKYNYFQDDFFIKAEQPIQNKLSQYVAQVESNLNSEQFENLKQEFKLNFPVQSQISDKRYIDLQEIFKYNYDQYNQSQQKFDRDVNSITSIQNQQQIDILSGKSEKNSIQEDLQISDIIDQKTQIEINKHKYTQNNNNKEIKKTSQVIKREVSIKKKNNGPSILFQNQHKQRQQTFQQWIDDSKRNSETKLPKNKNLIKILQNEDQQDLSESDYQALNQEFQSPNKESQNFQSKVNHEFSSFRIKKQLSEQKIKTNSVSIQNESQLHKKRNFFAKTQLEQKKQIYNTGMRQNVKIIPRQTRKKSYTNKNLSYQKTNLSFSRRRESRNKQNIENSSQNICLEKIDKNNSNPFFQFDNAQTEKVQKTQNDPFKQFENTDIQNKNLQHEDESVQQKNIQTVFDNFQQQPLLKKTMTNFSSTKKINNIKAEEPVQNNKQIQTLLDRLNYIKNKLTEIKNKKDIDVQQIFLTYILKLKRIKQKTTKKNNCYKNQVRKIKKILIAIKNSKDIINQFFQQKHDFIKIFKKIQKKHQDIKFDVNSVKYKISKLKSQYVQNTKKQIFQIKKLKKLNYQILRKNIQLNERLQKQQKQLLKELTNKRQYTDQEDKDRQIDLLNQERGLQLLYIKKLESKIQKQMQKKVTNSLNKENKLLQDKVKSLELKLLESYKLQQKIQELQYQLQGHKKLAHIYKKQNDIIDDKQFQFDQNYKGIQFIDKLNFNIIEQEKENFQRYFQNLHNNPNPMETSCNLYSSVYKVWENDQVQMDVKEIYDNQKIEINLYITNKTSKIIFLKNLQIQPQENYLKIKDKIPLVFRVNQFQLKKVNIQVSITDDFYLKLPQIQLKFDLQQEGQRQIDNTITQNLYINIFKIAIHEKINIKTINLDNNLKEQYIFDIQKAHQVDKQTLIEIIPNLSILCKDEFSNFTFIVKVTFKFYWAYLIITQKDLFDFNIKLLVYEKQQIFEAYINILKYIVKNRYNQLQLIILLLQNFLLYFSNGQAQIISTKKIK